MVTTVRRSGAPSPFPGRTWTVVHARQCLTGEGHAGNGHVLWMQRWRDPLGPDLVDANSAATPRIGYWR